MFEVQAGLDASRAEEEPRSRDPSAAQWVGAALEAALRARAPGVHASTPLVRRLAAGVSRRLGLDTQTEALLDLAARVRDVGMLALPDSVVLATATLSPADWTLVNRHPVLGQRLLEELHVVSPVAGLVRAHHERWDGGGYPDGLSGAEIPLVSRVIATCDAFVATASDRPHRRGMGAEAALELVGNERGSQFDPVVVDALASVLAGDAAIKTVDGQPGAGARVRRTAVRSGGAPQDLSNAILEFEVVPALAPAYERVLAATASNRTSGGELVAAVESDTGLTVAVLRHAQTVVARRHIANVADAVTALGATGVEEAVRGLPRAEFPWRTSQLQVLMHRSLVHAQAVARATDRIARETKLTERADVIVVALLHDIGKLVLGRAFAEYTGEHDRTSTPEQRVRQEQRSWGVDHASLGGLLLRNWGLPEQLAGRVAKHHSAEAENDIPTYVRLADMAAHHAQGDAVDSAKMLGLAELCGISASVLRDILFDLPHSSGSHRRRAEPSPLSRRETAILSLLADGRRYKEISLELDVAVSTVRTHLHNVYAKLSVDDRAQAVLRATEMGWI